MKMFQNMATVVQKAIEEMRKEGVEEVEIQESGMVVALADSDSAKKLSQTGGNLVQTIKVGPVQYSVFFGTHKEK